MVKTKEEIIENINELKKRAKYLSKMDIHQCQEKMVILIWVSMGFRHRRFVSSKK